MQPDYWLQRWQQGRTGFHRDSPMPLLQKYWPALGLQTGCRVLVPLCGKTLDMTWLAAQGFPVLGVELSALAIQQFLDENRLQATTRITRQGKHYRAGNIEIIQGDVLSLDGDTLAGCQAVYDRAAIIALPPALRQRYVDRVYGRLPAGCRGLMITLDYPQSEMQGPPFSVDPQEVRRLLHPEWDINALDDRDILADQPKFQDQGVSRLHTQVHLLHHLPSTSDSAPASQAV